MDTSSLPINGNQSSPLPLGFGMVLAMNEAAMQEYAGLTETEKEHLIMRCKDARSKEEMQKIVNSLVSDKTADSLLSEEKLF